MTRKLIALFICLSLALGILPALAQDGAVTVTDMTGRRTVKFCTPSARATRW